jgi:hypothetical protein
LRFTHRTIQRPCSGRYKTGSRTGPLWRPRRSARGSSSTTPAPLTSPSKRSWCQPIQGLCGAAGRLAGVRRQGAASCNAAPCPRTGPPGALGGNTTNAKGAGEFRPHPPYVDLAHAPDPIGGLVERQGDAPAPAEWGALRPASLAARAGLRLAMGRGSVGGRFGPDRWFARRRLRGSPQRPKVSTTIMRPPLPFGRIHEVSSSWRSWP